MRAARPRSPGAAGTGSSLTGARPDRRRVFGTLHAVARRSVLARSAHYKQVGPFAIVPSPPPAAVPGRRCAPPRGPPLTEPRPGTPQAAREGQQQRYRFVFPGSQVPQQQQAQEQDDDAQQVGGMAPRIAKPA